MLGLKISAVSLIMFVFFFWLCIMTRNNKAHFEVLAMPAFLCMISVVVGVCISAWELLS